MEFSDKKCEKSCALPAPCSQKLLPAPAQNENVDELKAFFDALYKGAPTGNFACLMSFKDGGGGISKVIPYEVGFESERLEMARKAIELNRQGLGLWHNVNLLDKKPDDGKRGSAKDVAYQTAVVVDIDILSPAHKSDKLAKDFDEAKAFLPFAPSILVNSGHGLHAYYLFESPLKITDDNRAETILRNQQLLDAVRERARALKIDAVWDLTRVLRTPCTYNYKLGRANAPMCRVLAVNDVRYSPNDVDDMLTMIVSDNEHLFSSNISSTKPAEQSPGKSSAVEVASIADADLSPDDLILAGYFQSEKCKANDMNMWLLWRGDVEKYFALVNKPYDDSSADLNLSLKLFYYTAAGTDDTEILARTKAFFEQSALARRKKWQDRADYQVRTIEAAYKIWVRNGRRVAPKYQVEEPMLKSAPDEESTQYELVDTDDRLEKLRLDLQAAQKELVDFHATAEKSIEQIRSIDTFDFATVMDTSNLEAASYTRVFDDNAFAEYKSAIKVYAAEHPSELRAFKDVCSYTARREKEIKENERELKRNITQLRALIGNEEFSRQNADVMSKFEMPSGYAMSQNGVVKVGNTLETIINRPTILAGKIFDIDARAVKLVIAYQTGVGKWIKLPAQSASLVYDRRKLVSLADFGIPLTSENAGDAVDYFSAFFAQNENNLPTIYEVSRCGWHQEQFIDPRLDCWAITKDDTKIPIKVSDASDFARHLKSQGSLDEWKRVYFQSKKYPVARFLVAAAFAAPLLKVVNERNFWVHIAAPTTSGKTTSLLLAASAYGSEKIIRSFDATKNGLIGAASDVNDYPFLIDERQVADAKLSDNLSSLVYALANGIGRTKLNRDSSVRKTAEWRTIIISTGEANILPNNSTGGAYTRLLSIQSKGVILPSELCRDIRDTAKTNYGHALPLFIEFLKKVGNERLTEMYQSCAEALTESNPDILPEYCRYVGLCAIADGLLNKALGVDKVEVNGKTLKPADDAAIQFQEHIIPLIPTRRDIADTPREIDFVQNFIAENQPQFLRGVEDDKHIRQIFGSLAADDFVYVTTKALSDACKRNGFDYKKLVADLISAGYFIPGDTIDKGYRNPRATVKQRIGGVPCWCYRIPRDKFTE